MPVDWAKGVGYSIMASIIGGASKLAIRKSWLMVADRSRSHNPNSTHEDTAVEKIFAENSTYESPKRIHASSPADKTSNSALEVASETGEEAEASGRLTPLPSHGANMELGSAFSTESEILALPTAGTRGASSNQRNEATTQKTAIALRLSGMIGMTFLNPLFCVLAMNYASPSILAPFSGLTLVWIVLFSETMIGEKPTAKQIVAACFIVMGEVIVAVWGDHTNDEGVDLDTIVESYKQPSFQLYFVCMFFWMMALVYIIVQRPSPTLRRFAWGVSGGSVTGFQNFLKDSLTIIKAVGEKDEAFPWYFYIMVILGIASSFGGLLFLTACMKRYDATFSSAMFVGSFVISASIMAAVHYQTFEHLENLSNYIMYPFGLIVLMIGVAMLVQATSEQDIEFDTGTDDQNDFQSDAHDYTNINAENSGSSNDMRYPLVQESVGKRD